MAPLLHLRPAIAANADFLFAVFESSMRDYAVATWGEWDAAAARQRRAGDIARGGVRIVACDGVAAGFVVTERHADHVHLDQIALLPAFQRRGIGTRLLRRLVVEAGALPLRLRVLRVNPAARRLYERSGFAVIDESPERFYMQRPSMSAAVAALWQSWPQAATRGADFYEAFHFEDNERGAHELAELVLAGTKRATAALLWSYRDAGQLPPRAGNVSAVTDFHGAPLCLVETTRVDIAAYADVDAGFAAVEGEGDGSLAFWRRAHDDYFGRECARIGAVAGPRMPVVCERFEVVHQP